MGSGLKDVVKGGALGTAIGGPGLGTAVGAGAGWLSGALEPLDVFDLFGESSEEKAYRKAMANLKKSTEQAAQRTAEVGPEIEQARWDAYQRAMALWEPYNLAMSEIYGPQYVMSQDALKSVFQNPFAGIDFKVKGSAPTVFSSAMNQKPRKEYG
jgi:hypothetical protein